MCTRLRVWLLQLFFFLICLLFRAFFFCFFHYFRAFFFSLTFSPFFFLFFSLHLLLLLSFGSSISLFLASLSHNNTLFLSFLYLEIRSVRSFSPQYYLAIPRFSVSLSVALFRLPPVLPSHKNYPETRESKRDREVRRGGIWRIGWSEGSGEIIVYRRG